MVGKLRIHGRVFVGFALDRQLQAAAEQGLLLLAGEAGGIVDDEFGMEQPEVGEGVLGFLGSGVAKQLGQLGVADLLGHLREK